MPPDDKIEKPTDAQRTRRLLEAQLQNHRDNFHYWGKQVVDPRTNADTRLDFANRMNRCLIRIETIETILLELPRWLASE